MAHGDASMHFDRNTIYHTAIMWIVWKTYPHFVWISFGHLEFSTFLGDNFAKIYRTDTKGKNCGKLIHTKCGKLH
jgi:hypothetical protein